MRLESSLLGLKGHSVIMPKEGALQSFVVPRSRAGTKMFLVCNGQHIILSFGLLVPTQPCLQCPSFGVNIHLLILYSLSRLSSDSDPRFSNHCFEPSMLQAYVDQERKANKEEFHLARNTKLLSDTQYVDYWGTCFLKNSKLQGAKPMNILPVWNKQLLREVFFCHPEKWNNNYWWLHMKKRIHQRIQEQ